MSEWCRIPDLFPPGRRGLSVLLAGLSGLFASLAGTGRSGHGEAERGDASVPLQGALQGPDSGEPAGRPGWGGGQASVCRGRPV